MYLNSSFGQYRYGIQLDENTMTVVSSRGGNLYSGIDNYFRISEVITEDYDTVLVHSTNGAPLPDSNDLVLLIPNRPGKVRLTYYGVSGYDTTTIGYQHFMVRRVPEPKMLIDDRPISTPGIIAKRYLLYCDSLGVYFSDDIIGSEYWLRVKEFTLGYNYGGFHVSHLNPSNKMTLRTRQILYRIGPDRTISIKLTVEAEGDIMRELPIYRLTIY
ncbi:MAG: hypothetical protein JW894_07155 [Bacteroidales bacterium]|nr:hypothetical protein [Bacteroidales bacterium]